MPEPGERWFVRLLQRVAHAVLRYPRWFFWPQVILARLCVFYTVARLQFSTSRNDRRSDKLHYHHISLQLRN